MKSSMIGSLICHASFSSNQSPQSQAQQLNPSAANKRVVGDLFTHQGWPRIGWKPEEGECK
jgi:hypothetical protein